jgi:mRNA-degrading endonuclease RelE of RelBE toxin-antitoxin system
MAYKAVYSKLFLKKAKRLPNSIRGRISREVKQIMVLPQKGKHLHGRLAGTRSQRVGKYRIVYEVLINKKEVHFHTIDLRKKVYG